MAMCPNFQSPEWKHLVNKLGELEAYKYFHQNNGDLSGVNIKKDLIERAKQHVDEIQGDVFKIAFERDPEQFLFEIAQQINSSKAEANATYDQVGENIFDIANRLFPETQVGESFNNIKESKLDPADDNPTTQAQRANEIQETKNKNSDKEPIVISADSDRNIKIEFGNPILKELWEKMDAGDKDAYNNFLLDNLYTRKEAPTTTELLNNAAKLSKDLGRQDLTDMARLIYKHLAKNQTLSTRMIDKMYWDKGTTKPKAYYDLHWNRVTFAKDTIGTGSLEKEVEVVLHELLHGLVFTPWYEEYRNGDLTNNQKIFKSTVDNYYNYFKSLPGIKTSLHAFKNSEEFLLASLMDDKFQTYLKSFLPKENNSFSKFIKNIFKSILKLFGIKGEDSIIDKINPGKFEKNMLGALSDYLGKMDKINIWNSLKEDNRDYGLSFAVVAEQDYQLERNTMKVSFTPEMRNELKKVVDKSILSIKSFGSNIRSRIPESQEGFKTIFRQLKKLEDPAYNIDQIDFFFDFTHEIQAIMNVANDKISKLHADETLTDPNFKLKEYEDIVSAVRNFDPILNDIQGVKVQFENLGNKAAVVHLNDMMLKRGRIESIYSMGVFPLVTDKFINILDEPSKKAIGIASDRIEELNKRIYLANKHNNKSRVLQLTKERDDEKSYIDKTLTLNSDNIQSWLRGQMGDSNIFNTWMLAGVSAPNPIVSGVSKYLRDNVGSIAPKVLDLQNSVQTSMEQYAKSTGRSMNNISEFNSPLIQVHKVINGKDDKGNYTYDDKLSLLHEFNNGHIQELQKFKRSLTDLYAQKRTLEDAPNSDQEKINELTDKIKDTKAAQRQFMRDYMEQQYDPRVHEAMDMLYEDLGGYSIWDYMGPILSRIEDTEGAIDQTEDQEQLSNLLSQLDDHNFELSRLGSLYEKSSDSREYKVAEHLKKRREALNKYTEYKLNEKGKIQFESEKSRMFRKLYNGDITKERYERWLEDNTVTEFAKKYWEKKDEITSSLNKILTQLGVSSEKNKEVQSLYKDMEDITKAHRDSNGIINGREMTDKELSDVKDTEEALERAKDKITNIMGLTKLERIELFNLKEQFNDIKGSLYFETDASKAVVLNNLLNEVENRINEITIKKKNLNKSLLDEYHKLLKKLSELDQSSLTKYYMDEVTERKEQEAAKVDISKIPIKFVSSGKTYAKSGSDWMEIGRSGVQKRDTDYVEKLWRDLQGEINFRSSEWYKINHINKTKYVDNQDYNISDPSSQSGKWEENEEPTYAWRQTRPKDESYILQNQPSLKYKKREIKDQYVNKNYKEDINGDLRPKINGAKDDRFINKDYHKLVNSTNQSDVATSKMLSFLTDTYFKSQEAIPKGMRPGYELPAIRKSDIERLSGQNLKQNSQDFFEYLGQVSRLWKDKVVKNDQDKDILYGYNDDFTGIVPVKFIGDIDSKDQSIDLPKSILTFATEMVKREQLIKSLPFVNAVKDIVNNPDYKPVKTKDGVIQSVKKKFLPKNTEVAKKSYTNNTALQINEIIKSEIYGEQMKDIPGTKLVNSALSIGATVMLGLNFISSVQNYANAFTQSIMETESKNKNFTMKNFFEAQKIYYANVDKLMGDLGKYGNKSYINQFFDYFGGINFKIFSKNHRSLAHGKLAEFTSALSVPNTITEHMLNYHMGIAIGLNYRVSDSKGNMIPIFNAFTLRDGKLVQKEGFNITDKERNDMISRLNSSARRVNGEYGDRILADKYSLGKLATFMNRYLVPFVVKRYGARGFDIQDGVRDEGYWRLFGKTILKDIKAKSVPILMGWKYYTTQEKKAILKATTEFGFTVMFYLMIKALGGGDDKHLRDNSALTNNLIYALKGIQQQNEAFMPVPGIGFDDLLRKVQNPFPILGKVKNLVSIIQDGSHSLFYEMGLPGVDKNDVFYNRNVGWHKPGDLKVMADFEKLIGLQRIANYIYPDQAIKNADAMQRIK